MLTARIGLKKLRKVQACQVPQKCSRSLRVNEITQYNLKKYHVCCCSYGIHYNPMNFEECCDSTMLYAQKLDITHQAKKTDIRLSSLQTPRTLQNSAVAFYYFSVESVLFHTCFSPLLSAQHARSIILLASQLPFNKYCMAFSHLNVLQLRSPFASLCDSMFERVFPC